MKKLILMAAVALMELTPGPNMGWLALVSLSQGRTAGLAAVAGITLGLTLWMVAAAFGLTELGLKSVVVASIGYRSEQDFNASLTKSRLPAEQIGRAHV